MLSWPGGSPRVPSPVFTPHPPNDGRNRELDGGNSVCLKSSRGIAGTVLEGFRRLERDFTSVARAVKGPSVDRKG